MGTGKDTKHKSIEKVVEKEGPGSKRKKKNELDREGIVN